MKTQGQTGDANMKEFQRDRGDCTPEKAEKETLKYPKCVICGHRSYVNPCTKCGDDVWIKSR